MVLHRFNICVTLVLHLTEAPVFTMVLHMTEDLVFTMVLHRFNKGVTMVLIRAVLNDVLDEHVVVVVWIVSGMKELFHFPNQLLPVAIHQNVYTRLHILPAKDASNVVYVIFSLDVTCHPSEVQ